MASSAWAAADPGPVLQGQLYPLNNQGRLRIYYNWLYSALNCDPGNTSDFYWTINKLDDTHVSLSPRDGYNGMTLYASVRPDWSYQVEVQAPGSADWIQAVGGDEILGFETQDLMTVSFTGLNGQYIALDGQPTEHQDSNGNDHTGYLLHSAGTSDPRARLFFLGVNAVLQPRLQVALQGSLTADDIRRSYVQNGLQAGDDDIARMLRQFE